MPNTSISEQLSFPVSPTASIDENILQAQIYGATHNAIDSLTYFFYQVR